jgi:CO/xanthine dehydrogenase FAD-binding subunit
MATLTEMEQHPALRTHLGGVMPEVMRHVGSPLLRNVATIGGHLARGRLSDVVPVLLALDASISFHDGADRTMTLAGYYAGEHHRTTHVITEVTLPAAAPGAGAAFLKFSRTFFDLAILNAACRIDPDGGVVGACRIAVGETPDLARTVPEAEAALTGRVPDEEAIAAAADAAAAAVEVRGDSRGSADYRTALVAPAVRRSLASAAARLGGAA